MADLSDEYGFLDRPIPRISLHAFRTTQPMVAAIEGAAIDRRFLKVRVTVTEGGFAEAINYYQERSTPDLLFIESHDHLDQIRTWLPKLAAVSEKHTKLIVASNINDIDIYREMSRYGVSDYIILPASSIKIIDVVARLFGAYTPKGKIAAFMSAKGGSGSSILAHDVAWHAAHYYNIDTVLADYDMCFGSAAINLNLSSPRTLADILDPRIKIDPAVLESVLEPCGKHLWVAAAPCRLNENFRFTTSACESIADSARRTAGLTVIDLPYGFLQNNRETLMQADLIVLVTTPETTGIRNAAAIYEILREARPNDSDPIIMLNQCGVPGREEVSIAKFENIFDFRPDFVIPYAPSLFGKAGSNRRLPSQVAANLLKPEVEPLRRLTALLCGKRMEYIQEAEKTLKKSPPLKKSKSFLSKLGLSL